MPHLDHPPYMALDCDDQSAPGCETIKIARLDTDLRIEVHRFSDVWPTEPCKVRVVIDGKTTTYEKDVKGTNANVWTVCLLKRRPRGTSVFRRGPYIALSEYSS